MRQETLRSLNALERYFGVLFSKDLLFMKPVVRNLETPRAKVEGLRYFQDRGYRVFAVVDDEPHNIAAMAELDMGGEILFLQTNDFLQTKDVPSSRIKSVSGYTTTRTVPNYEKTAEGSLV
jgi:hypothetical protein